MTAFSSKWKYKKKPSWFGFLRLRSTWSFHVLFREDGTEDGKELYSHPFVLFSSWFACTRSPFWQQGEEARGVSWAAYTH